MPVGFIKKHRAAALLLLAVGALAAFIALSGRDADFSGKYSGEDLSRSVLASGARTPTLYLDAHRDAPVGKLPSR